MYVGKRRKGSLKLTFDEASGTNHCDCITSPYGRVESEKPHQYGSHERDRSISFLLCSLAIWLIRVE
jgi:hypothetical protein